MGAAGGRGTALFSRFCAHELLEMFELCARDRTTGHGRTTTTWIPTRVIILKHSQFPLAPRTSTATTKRMSTWHGKDGSECLLKDHTHKQKHTTLIFVVFATGWQWSMNFQCLFLMVLATVLSSQMPQFQSKLLFDEQLGRSVF
jgi:hypothetical protein